MPKIGQHTVAKPGNWASVGEAGSYAGLKLCCWVHRLFGRWVFRVVLVPVMAYFFLRRGAQRRASREYLQKLAMWQPGCLPRGPRWWINYRHFLAFGEALVDRVIGWSGSVGVVDFDLLDRASYQKIMDDRSGCLIIGSHFGNLEFCRAFATRYRDITINALLHDDHAANFARIMAELNPDSRLNLFPVTELDVATMLRLMEKVTRGEWLVIAADRVPVTAAGRTTTVDFLGVPAAFPIGPYVLAATLRCRVITLFAWRVGRRIKILMELFANPLVLPRQARDRCVNEAAQRFATRLSERCAQAPLQWFNFYPFWQDE